MKRWSLSESTVIMLPIICTGPIIRTVGTFFEICWVKRKLSISTCIPLFQQENIGCLINLYPNTSSSTDLTPLMSNLTLTNPNWRAFLFKWRIFNANDYLYESFLLKSRIASKMSTIYSIPNKCDWKNKSDLIVIFILTSDKTKYLSHICYIYRTLQKHKKTRFI